MLTIRSCCIAVLMSCFGFAAQASVIQAVSCSSTDVQNAINTAANGDSVALPSGCSSTWNATVSIPGTKGLTLIGNGANIARGNLADRVAAIALSVNGSTGSRITGFSFSDGKAIANGTFISVAGGNESSAKFRIDHCSFVGNDVGVHIKTE